VKNARLNSAMEATLADALILDLARLSAAGQGRR
jgi:hypothetical protein